MNAPVESKEETHLVRLVYALNAASEALQRSIHSEEEVFQAVSEQIRKLGLRGGVSLLDESGTRLKLRVLALPENLRNALEKLGGSAAYGYEFETARVEVYQKVIETGVSQFTSNSAEVILQLLPESAKPNAEKVLKLLGAPPAIYAPIRSGGKIIGILNVVGGWLTPHMIPAIEAFANQTGIAIEHAHLFERAETERRHLQLLFDISRELVKSLDAYEVLDRAVARTCAALNGLVGQAFLYSPEEERLNLCALHGRPAIPRDELRSRVSLRLGEGLAGWVAQHRQAVVVADVSLDQRWLQVDPIDDGVRSVISAPIVMGEQLFGVISVLHPQIGAFSQAHLDLLQAISREIGLALSHASQYEQLQRRLSEITLIQDLAQIFNQRLDLQNLLDEVVLQLGQRFGYPRVDLYLVGDNRLVQRAHFGKEPKLKTIPLDQGILGRVARTGEAALVLDVSQDPDYLACVENTVSELAVPIYKGKVVVGVINIETDCAGQLTNQDKELVLVLAGQISIALENAVLYDRIRRYAEDLERTVRQRTAELTELYELSQEIGYNLSYEQLMRLLLSHLRNAIQSDLVAGGLYLDRYSYQLVETARPIAPSAMEALRHFWQNMLMQEPNLSRGWESASLEVISAGDFNARARPLNRIGEWVSAPMRIDNVLVGVLIAGYEDGNVSNQGCERLLITFAHQAAAALQRVQSMLAEQQKRLEHLVEHLPIGVLLLDDDFRLLLANPLGKAFLSVLKAGNGNGRLARLGSLRLTDLISRHTDLLPVEVATEGRPRRIFEVQMRPIRSEKRHWVLTLREVTQEREFQNQIQMQDRLATVGQLAAGIAHDFNNIMAAILVYTDLLRNDEQISAEARDRLNIIQQQVERASSLIRQILDFSRRSVMEQSTLDLLPFLKELDKMLRRVMPETISLRLSYLPGEYVVKADPTRLQQALVNLAVNARDAMPDGGTLQFELGKFHLLPGETPPIADMPPGNWIRISVRDSGIGIPEENMVHIFEPFFTTKPVGQGTGLGLAQVYGIVRQHEGFIEVHSQPGAGTAFNIYLPAQTALEAETPHPELQVEVNGAGRKVLVVEDDPTTLKALQTLLEARQYQVLAAANGAKALRDFEAEMETVDLVISDIVMPEMGGLALYRITSERWPHIRMLFITGHPLDGESQALLEKGEVAWLQKPFSIQQFNRAIQALMQDKLHQAM